MRELVRRIEADFRRSADTHLLVLPLAGPPYLRLRLQIQLALVGTAVLQVKQVMQVMQHHTSLGEIEASLKAQSAAYRRH